MKIDEYILQSYNVEQVIWFSKKVIRMKSILPVVNNKGLSQVPN